MGLGAAATSAGYFVFQKRWLNHYTALDLTAYAVWTGTAAMLVFVRDLAHIWSTIPAPTFLAVVYLGLVPTVVGYTLWGYALTHLPASRVSSALYLEPVATFALAWLLLGEVPAPAALIGAAATIGGVALINSAGNCRKRTL
ncbi:MAG: DMT family transporter [Steroidobacteraceae bacterium]